MEKGKSAFVNRKLHLWLQTRPKFFHMFPVISENVLFPLCQFTVSGNKMYKKDDFQAMFL